MHYVVPKDSIIYLFEFFLNIGTGMKRLAGVLCAFLGVILLVGGYVASWYMVRKPLHPHYPALVDTYPYQYLAFPLTVLGVILIVAGGVTILLSARITNIARI